MTAGVERRTSGGRVEWRGRREEESERRASDELEDRRSGEERVGEEGEWTGGG